MATVPEPPEAVAALYAAAPSPQRETMLVMRERILAVIPEADEIVKYRMPTFAVDGRDVCGLLPHTKHVGFYPYSGSLLEQFPELVTKYGGTKGALHVPVDKPLPATEIRRLVRARLALGR
jgi:uncharacterized protein YdhG (YjbR/CyaY superfamily)